MKPGKTAVEETCSDRGGWQGGGWCDAAEWLQEVVNPEEPLHEMS